MNEIESIKKAKNENAQIKKILLSILPTLKKLSENQSLETINELLMKFTEFGQIDELEKFKGLKLSKK